MADPRLDNMDTDNTTASSNTGAVIAVRGSVVDVRFDERMPPIFSVLRAGTEKQIIIEAMAHLDAHRVRGIALTPTQGLARGMEVKDTGGPLKAPVGKGILSRMFDVFVNTIDRGETLSDVQWRSVHRAPPPLARRSIKSEIFETGIKAIDVLVPLERGGKAGLFGGAGVGKTVLLTYGTYRTYEWDYGTYKPESYIPLSHCLIVPFIHPIGPIGPINHPALSILDYRLCREMTIATEPVATLFKPAPAFGYDGWGGVIPY